MEVPSLQLQVNIERGGITAASLVTSVPWYSELDQPRMIQWSLAKSRGFRRGWLWEQIRLGSELSQLVGTDVNQQRLRLPLQGALNRSCSHDGSDGEIGDLTAVFSSPQP